MPAQLPRFAMAMVLPLLPMAATAERYARPEATVPCEETISLHHLFSLGDETERLRHLQEFSRRFPEHEAAGWVLEQTQVMLEKRRQWDEVLAVGEKLLKRDGEDIEAAYRNLQAAEALKDGARVKIHAGRAAAVAARVIARPDAPKQEMARQVTQYCEYLDLVEINQAQDGKRRLDLMAEFERKHPRSVYLPNVQALYFAVYEQLGQRAKAIALAEQMIAQGSTSEELIVSIAEHYFKAGDLDKAFRYAARAIQVAGQALPDESSDPDAGRRAARSLGRAYWMAGKIQMERGQFAPADALLRQALPRVRSNEALLAAVLFHLGWVNYKLGNLADAEKFNHSCLQYKGTFQEAAKRNLDVIRVERSAAR